MKRTKKAIIFPLLVMAMTLCGSPAHAAGFAGSVLGSGIMAMVRDVSSFLVVLCPVAGAAAAVYFLIRRGMADDQDGKMWTRRIIIAIICGVSGALVSGIISWASTYF